MFGKKKRIIAEQEERIRMLEQQLEASAADNKRLKERVIDVERRERGIGRALNEATAAADNVLADAQKKASVLVDQAKSECDSIRKKSERIVEDAYRAAREIVREAENENARKRAELEQRIEQYAALLGNYDAMVQEQLQTAQDGAKRFAELSRALHEAVPQLLGTDGSPMPGLSTPDAGSDQNASDVPDMPDYTAHPLSYPSSREGGDDQLWTVDKIAGSGSGDTDSDVDAIIDDILAAAEDEQ